MKKIVIATLSFMIMSFAFAQPGKLRGPGGQYSERMEMMMIWKLTDHLELSEEQAEKFFPSMRLHQKQVLEIRKEEKELFSPTFAKVKKGDQISKSEINKLLNKVESFEQKKIKTRTDFIKKSGDILNPTQQVKLMMFEPHIRDQLQDRMKERYKPPMRGGNPKGKRRF